MRAGVVGVAVALAAAIGAMGVLAWSVLHGGSGKAGALRVAGAADRPATAGAGAARTGRRGPRALPGGLRPGPAPPDPGDDPGDPRPTSAPTSGEASGRAEGPTPAGHDPVDPGPRPHGAAPTIGLPGTSPGSGLAGGAGPPACPPGMVDTGAFCIDATEVTNAAYAAFLDTRPSLEKQPEVCRWNASFTPVYGAPRGDDRPVIGVDWCDAHAYCAAAGKGLCGHVGGGPNPVGAFADASQSQWYAACTNGGTTRFSYGDTFDESLCFHPGDDGALAPAGSYPKCAGATPPYDQLFDMSGNAREWEDSCAGSAGGADLCRVRGGWTQSASAGVGCGMDYLARRDNTSRAIGLRCCAPRTPPGP